MRPAHSRFDGRLHPLPVTLVRGAPATSRVAADPLPGARLFGGGDHPYGFRKQHGVDIAGDPPRNRRPVQVLARVLQQSGVERAEHHPAFGTAPVGVVLLGPCGVGRLRRRTHRRADLAAVEEARVGSVGDELPPVPPDGPEVRVDVGFSEPRRTGSRSATAAFSSSGPRVPAASHSGSTALHSRRCRARSSRITSRWASPMGNVNVRGSWLASAPAPSDSLNPPPSRITLGIQPLRRVNTMSLMPPVSLIGRGRG